MSSMDDDVQCEVMWKLTQERKYDDIIDHVLGCCLQCLKRDNKHEMLFPDAPPPWIKIPESEKHDPQAFKKYEKKKVHVQMSPEEFDQFLIDSEYGDEKMVFELCKFKRVERTVAWKLVREIRGKQRAIRTEKEKEAKAKEKLALDAKREAEKLKKADEKRKSTEKKQDKVDSMSDFLEQMQEEKKLIEDEEDEESGKETEETTAEQEPETETFKNEKAFNLKKQMPWCPLAYEVLCLEARSVIDHMSQKRIIAMCQNLMYHGSFQHNSNKRELSDLRKAAQSEYEALTTAALEHARNETVHPTDYLIAKNLKFCFNLLKLKSARLSGSFMFSSPSNSLQSIEPPSGITNMNMVVKPIFEKLMTEPEWIDELVIPDITKKCEIGKDKHSDALPKAAILEDETVKKMLDISQTVTVAMDATTACHLLAPNWEARNYDFGIHVQVKETSDGRKTVVLSKPIPFGSINKASMQRFTLKRLLKNQFVKRNEKLKAAIARKPTGVVKKDPTTSEETPSSSSMDFLDDILSGMSKTEKSGPSAPSKNETGYQYAVFNIGATQMLVRSRPPFSAIQTSAKTYEMLVDQRVSFEPRIEYLPNGGAMDLGAEEWVWNFAKAVFKMSDAHVLYRTSYKLDHLLQLDALTMRLESSEAPPQAYGLLSARTMMLEKLIAQLEDLDVGEYLAYQQSGRPLVVVPKCEEGGVRAETMYIRDSDVKTSADNSDDNDFFNGFSPDVPFQWQIVQGRAPRMLIASDSPMLERLPTKSDLSKQWRMKKEAKRKWNEQESARNVAKRKRTLDLDDPNMAALLDGSLQKPNTNNHKGKFQWGRGGKRGKGRRGRGRGRGGPAH